MVLLYHATTKMGMFICAFIFYVVSVKVFTINRLVLDTWIKHK